MSKNTYERYALINTDTGEVVTEVVKKQNEELNISTTKNLTDSQKEYLKKKAIIEALHKAEVDAMKGIGKYYEGFVWLYYVKDQLLLKTSGLDYQDIARVLFLGTYLGYGEKTGNMLVVKRNQRVIEPMTRADMMNILGLSESTFKRFLKNAKASGILTEVKKQFFLNEEYFIKGNPSRKKEYTRLYIAPIRNLFKGVKTKDHKSIGIIMSLIPFLNYDMNYLEKSNGDYMTLKEMNELLGYDEDNVSRLFKQLRALKVEYGGKEHPIIVQMVLNEDSEEREERIYINPMIAYRGKCPEYLHEVVRRMLFKRRDKANKEEGK